MKRHTVYLKIEVQAKDIEQAHRRVQALADTLNKKDPKNKAHVSKIVVHKDKK